MDVWDEWEPISSAVLADHADSTDAQAADLAEALAAEVLLVDRLRASLNREVSVYRGGRTQVITVLAVSDHWVEALGGPASTTGAERDGRQLIRIAAVTGWLGLGGATALAGDGKRHAPVRRFIEAGRRCRVEFCGGDAMEGWLDRVYSDHVDLRVPTIDSSRPIALPLADIAAVSRF